MKEEVKNLIDHPVIVLMFFAALVIGWNLRTLFENTHPRISRISRNVGVVRSIWQGPGLEGYEIGLEEDSDHTVIVFGSSLPPAAFWVGEHCEVTFRNEKIEAVRRLP